MLLIFQHVEHEGPGLIGEMAEGRGIAHRILHPYRDDLVPGDLAGIQGIVSMGGGMSVNDLLPWLHRERDLLASACKAGIPVLGVCLGAQLLSQALGARVKKGPVPETGWGEVVLTPGAEKDSLLRGVGERLPVLHWHGETFDLPGGSILLASSAAYPHQAFRWGARAWGFQFHLEVTGNMVSRWLELDKGESCSLVANPAQIGEGIEAWIPLVRMAGSIVFGHFLDLVRGAGSRGWVH